MCETLGLDISTVDALIPLVRKTSNWSMPPLNEQPHATPNPLLSQEEADAKGSGGGGGEGDGDISDAVLSASWESPLEAAEREER